MSDSFRYFTLNPKELNDYVLEAKPEPSNPDKNKDKNRGINLKEIKDDVESLHDALKQRAKEFNLPAPKLEVPPLPSDFTKEHLKALGEVFGLNNLEATVCPKVDDLTDEYFEMMYPKMQKGEDTANGLKSYHPDWWAKTADAGFSITDEEARKTNQKRAVWGELYTKSMRAEADMFQNMVLLSETIQKPNYIDGTQQYGTKEGVDATKDLLLPIIKQVFGNTASRFNLTWDQINQQLIPKLKEKILNTFQAKKLKSADVEIIITPATIFNLQTSLRHPDDSQTNTSDWSSTPLIDQYNKDSGHRLIVGNSDNGGAGFVNDDPRGRRWDDRGFRLSVVLKNT